MRPLGWPARSGAKQSCLQADCLVGFLRRSLERKAGLKAGLQGADDMMHHLAISLRTLETLFRGLFRWTMRTGVLLGARGFRQRCVGLVLLRIQELPQLN